jgi:hypothetical protein
MSNAVLSFIGVVVGALLFCAGFITVAPLIAVGGILVALSVIYPFIVPRPANA